MTCNWPLSSVIFDLFAMNSFTKCISAMPPASKPRESWKINPGLLRNTSSFSMLCDPRWEDVSSTEIIKGDFTPAQWATPPMCRSDHQQCINVCGRSCGSDVAPCSLCYQISLVVLTCCTPSGGLSSCLHWHGLWREHESGRPLPEFRRFEDRIWVSNLEGYLRLGTSCSNERFNL